MFKICEIDHVVIRVVNLDKMLNFYCQVLGCNIEKEQTDIGLIQLRAGRSLIDLVPVDGPIGKEGGAAPGKEGKNMDHLCLRIEPFEEESLVQYFNEHQIPIEEITLRYGAKGEGPSIYIQDPEGNKVELKGTSHKNLDETFYEVKEKNLSKSI